MNYDIKLPELTLKFWSKDTTEISSFMKGD